ncbi:MAG: hypothetical protein ACLRSW_02405 [Christensenellaceae bacterium]
MEKKAAYEGLAEWFEYLNDDCGYEKWSQYLISKETLLSDDGVGRRLRQRLVHAGVPPRGIRYGGAGSFPRHVEQGGGFGV